MLVLAKLLHGLNEMKLGMSIPLKFGCTFTSTDILKVIFPYARPQSH